MKHTKRVTQKARKLAAIWGRNRLAAEIGISTSALDKKFVGHGWKVSEAETIEKLMQELIIELENL